MTKYNQIKGNKTYRHEQNPDEKQLHDNFLEHIGCNYDTMDQIAFSPQSNGRLNDREKALMVTTIQWLGSPVGQCFLCDNGYIKQK